MSDIEKRRIQLLQDTRKIYSDNYSPPAIHPRYQSAYSSLYGSESQEQMPGVKVFFLRFLVAICIFGVLFLLDYRNEKIGNVSSQTIISEIQKDLFRK